MARSVLIRPGRISITPSARSRDMIDQVKIGLDKHLVTRNNSPWYENFQKRQNPFVLSDASRRKVMDSINSMYELSPKRDIPMGNNRTLFNFRMAFITLTLPADQVHTDLDIKSRCLNQFLVELRRHYDVSNYVWKAELQDNENIHFHILTDQYVDYQALRRRWNRCIEKLGYVSRYRDNMSRLSLTEYHALRNRYKKCDFKKSAAAYAAGKMSNWSNPNSVDVRSIHSTYELGGYIAKYMCKEVDPDDQSDELNDRQISFGRSWSRSQSLSRLQYRNRYSQSDLAKLLRYLRANPKKFMRKQGDYYEVIYFKMKDMPAIIRRWLSRSFKSNAILYNYPFPNTEIWHNITQRRTAKSAALHYG